MKKIILVLLAVMAMSCQIDHDLTDRAPKTSGITLITIKRITVLDSLGAILKVIYTDNQGNPILDQDLIDKIELNKDGYYNIVDHEAK